MAYETHGVLTPLHVIEPEQHRSLLGKALQQAEHDRVPLGRRSEAHVTGTIQTFPTGTDQLGEGMSLVAVVPGGPDISDTFFDRLSVESSATKVPGDHSGQSRVRGISGAV